MAGIIYIATNLLKIILKLIKLQILEKYIYNSPSIIDLHLELIINKRCVRYIHCSYTTHYGDKLSLTL